jgi:hypothetical protein
MNGVTIAVFVEFMGIVMDDELREIVLHQASFAFMKEHENLFDDHLVSAL